MPTIYSTPSIFEFPDFSPLAKIFGAGRTEAEDLSIGSGFMVKSNPHPSAGQYLEANAAQSQAGGVFAGATGYYNLTLGYFDETDGTSFMEILVNGAVVAAFDWGAPDGSQIVTAAAKREYLVEGLHLGSGDIIELRGARDGGEPLRTDYIDISPGEDPGPASNFSLEAEDLAVLSGFEVVRNGAASASHVLQQSGGGTARACYTMEQTGIFDLTLGYFDENDGISELWVTVNGAEVARFLWDGTSGSNLANKASLTEYLIPDLSLKAGDVIELSGQGDGGEPLRLDYLDFAVRAAAPAPPPDLWFEDHDYVVVALNDGAGNFTEVVTDIATDVYYLPGQPDIARGGASIMSADLNGDGLNDFIKVSHAVTELPDLPPATIDLPFSFTVTTEVYLNDGAAGFDLAATSQEKIDLDLQEYAYDGVELPDDLFKAYAAGDIDGDGDIDYFATSFAGETLFVMENDGANSFSVQATTVFELGATRNDARIADMNGDGLLDAIVTTGLDLNRLDVLINDGTGTMVPMGGDSPSEGPTGNPQAVDLDGDGDLDVLHTAAGESYGIYGYLNDGSGGKAIGGPILAPSDGTTGTAIGADLDGDGDIEMITGSHSDDYSGELPGLRVFDIVVGDTLASFEEVYYNPNIVGNVLAPADYDGDGDIDMLIISDGFRMLENDGTGAFSLGDEVIPPFATSEYSWVPRVQTGYFQMVDEMVF
ncbi:VCBS repeat-containing protein [Salipiger sp. PrR007]|uniref:FG-GAP repeat domain-containing protein n=1 Tax=Salipiger sp. PrR007 TaxID=2706884 RepID=UPI0013BD580D|nr:VCBS repeat-containing protein [Salipiger sp. PrR007]NDW33377.1 VCBS repeat-containing protein [Salipiger sp. PrR007]